MCIVWVSTHIYTALQTNNPQQNKTPTCNSVVLLPQAILKEIWRIFGFGRRTTWTQNSNQTEVLWSRKVVRTSLKSQCDISDSTVILWNYENARTLAPASAAPHTCVVVLSWMAAKSDVEEKKCDPLGEIQAKVSKSNYEKTSIKIWFQSLTWPYSVNIKDIKVKFSQNVLYHMKDDFVCRKQQITNNDFSWVFREGHKLLNMRLFFFAHKKYSRSYITLRLNQ